MFRAIHGHRRAGVMLAALIGLAPASFAVARARPTIAVSRAWTRPAMAGMNGAGYLTISNMGPRPDRLTGAASADAAQVSIHESRQVGAVMTMRALTGLDIPAGGSVSLAPGGYHLMVLGLKRSLRPGDKLTLRLHFVRAGDLNVSFAVIAGAAMMPRMPM